MGFYGVDYSGLTFEWNIHYAMLHKAIKIFQLKVEIFLLQGISTIRKNPSMFLDSLKLKIFQTRKLWSALIDKSSNSM